MPKYFRHYPRWSSSLLQLELALGQSLGMLSSGNLPLSPRGFSPTLRRNTPQNMEQWLGNCISFFVVHHKMTYLDLCMQKGGPQRYHHTRERSPRSLPELALVSPVAEFSLFSTRAGGGIASICRETLVWISRMVMTWSHRAMLRFGGGGNSRTWGIPHGLHEFAALQVKQHMETSRSPRDL